MSLKNRIRITTLLFLILGGAIIGFMSLRSAINVFKDLENDNARNNMQRTLNALQQEQTNLDILLSDWASWDDTYEYIENLNSDYEEANIAPSAFETLRLNLMIFINKKGKVVKAIYFDLDSLRAGLSRRPPRPDTRQPTPNPPRFPQQQGQRYHDNLRWTNIDCFEADTDEPARRPGKGRFDFRQVHEQRFHSSFRRFDRIGRRRPLVECRRTSGRCIGGRKVDGAGAVNQHSGHQRI